MRLAIMAAAAALLLAACSRAEGPVLYEVRSAGPTAPVVAEPGV